MGGNQRIIQYEPKTDRQNYQRLDALRVAHSTDYEKKKRGIDGLTAFNLQTALAERFNTLISERTDAVINGKICDINTKEPCEDIYERGRTYRERNGSSVHDQKRELAEVNSFKNMIAPVLLDPQTAVGTIVVSISPPGGEGSVYQHNFVDLFEKRIDAQGNVVVKAVRKATNLSLDEYMQKAKKLDARFPDAIKSSDLHFLENQIIVDPRSAYGAIEKLMQFFHKEEDGIFMGQEVFRQIIEAVTPYIHAYIALLAKDPENEEQQLLYYRAILNKADAQWRVLREEESHQIRVVSAQKSPQGQPTYMDIYRFGTQKVRAVNTGCGYSGDVASSQSPFSVKDFGETTLKISEDRYGSLEFPCPHKGCEKTNKRPYGKLIKNCTHCGKNVQC